MTTPKKGTKNQRRTWKRWARSQGLTDANGRFIFTSIDERRSHFRIGLKKMDISLLKSIENTLIGIVHPLNSGVELWPETIRRILNNTSRSDPESGPFESWVGPQGLEKRKQATRVWTDLIQFFVLEHHINMVTVSDDDTSLKIRQSSYLSEMGFTLSEDLGDDILDIVQNQSLQSFGIENLTDCIQEFCLSIITQANPTPQNNPLLFWVALSLQTEEFGNGQRLEFDGLKDELTMREKLEALVHYARVFIMDHAGMSWIRSRSGKTPIQTWMTPRSWDWIDNGLPRPVDRQGDPADFDQRHWQAFKTQFEALHTRWLVKGSNSPIGVILELL